MNEFHTDGFNSEWEKSPVPDPIDGILQEIEVLASPASECMSDSARLIAFIFATNKLRPMIATLRTASYERGRREVAQASAEIVENMMEDGEHWKPIVNRIKNLSPDNTKSV